MGVENNKRWTNPGRGNEEWNSLDYIRKKDFRWDSRCTQEQIAQLNIYR
jgi:hypothetical protein